MRTNLFPLESITQRIIILRGQKVLLDTDLAVLYDIETRRLNEQVRRNQERFPKDFIFELTDDEFSNLISQNAISSWGGRRTLPLAFTEHGAIMAASVLKSPRAIDVSVFIVRAFVTLRDMAASNKELASRLDALEDKVEIISTNQDVFSENTQQQLKQVFIALRELMTPPEAPKKRSIGFVTPEDMPQKSTKIKK
jgi:hypothetical protein